MKIQFLSILFLALFVGKAQAAYLVKERVSALGQVETLAVVPSLKQTQKEVLLRQTKEFLSEHALEPSLDTPVYRERLVPEELLSLRELSFLQSNFEISGVDTANFEIRNLILQGPANNRINLPIVAEGYTLNEKEKFFEDAERITYDLFGHKAFASYLPLFNVYAIFVESRESGVSDTKRVDTAFGSYRTPRGSKRAIIPGDTRALERVLAKAPGADYPILLVNDDFYGGLGGRFAVTTRSLNSGSMVLRHELGHNFGNVGEEYDGGQVYSGANFSYSASNLKWAHWSTGAKSEKFETKFLEGAYVWQDLTNRPVEINFSFPNGDYLLELKISSVGWSNPEEVEISLDGQRIDYQGVFTEDRSFFYLPALMPISPGRHKLSIVDRSKDGDNVLAFANIYAQPSNIITDHDHISAYAVFDANQNHQGYRPSFETCIMRNMRSEEFCVVDKENMWHRFLNKVRFVDSMSVTTDGTTNYLEVEATPLTGLVFEIYDQRNQLLTSSTSKQIALPGNITSGKLKVRFETPEVRNYSQDFYQEYSF